MINFESILAAKLSKHENIFVSATSSTHWNQIGRFWLAQFCGKKILESGKTPIIISEVIEGWPHHEFQIISYDEFVKTYSSGLIINSVSHNCPFSENLKALANFETFDMTAYSIEPKKVGVNYSVDELNKINKLYSLLSDSESCSILTSLLAARLTGDVGVLKKSKYPIYFHPTFNHQYLKRGSFIDGGAFDGSETFKFRELLQDDYKVYGYEYDSRNYKRFLSNPSEGNVIFFNKGLWSENGSGIVEGDGIGAKVSLNQSTEADVNILVALDTESNGDGNISFIKLDIEGAEVEAILGAKKIIKSQSPYMSISIYHKPNDIYEIPLLINSINGSYRFYIGQHDNLLSETVLYCVPG